MNKECTHMTQEQTQSAPAKLLTPKARLSYPYLFKVRPLSPDDDAGKKPRFECEMLFPKATDLSALQKAVDAAIAARWPDPAKRPKNLSLPIKDGDEKADRCDGYAGCYYIKPWTYNKPRVVDGHRADIRDEDAMYGGCYVRANVTCYAYDKLGKRGVAFGLLSIQKMADGDRFGGVSNDPQKDFDDVEAVATDATGEFPDK
jgi:hypothetical protein